MTREATFSTEPAAPVDPAAPLARIAIQFGNPIEDLPPTAVEKFRALQLKRDQAGTLARAVITDQQELRSDIQRHENRIKELTMPRGEGGFGLDDNSPQVVAEREKLSRRRADLQPRSQRHMARS